MTKAVFDKLNSNYLLISGETALLLKLERGEGTMKRHISECQTIPLIQDSFAVGKTDDG